MQSKTFPTLYKTTSVGKEQQWDISVQELSDNTANIVTLYGQVGGKIQESVTHITEGKNLGKSNETSIWDQACSEAESKWLKQKDKTYSEERGGGSKELKPMLAHKYEDHKDKVVFPAFIQPKLDGVRAIAFRDGDTIRLISRQGKEHKGLQHIRDELLLMMRPGDLWDGELYVHGMPFQTVISLVKKDQADSTRVEYHVYDLVGVKIFGCRYLDYRLSICRRHDEIHEEASLRGLDEEYAGGSPVKAVMAVSVDSIAGVEAKHEEFVSQGYEGAMLRWGDCAYKQGFRSKELLKVKAFEDGEFEIVDVVPGVGKMETQGIFVCKTDEGEEFRAKPKGRDALRERYLAEKVTLIGKMLTVRYFSMTDSEKPVPRFPIGICVRDYE